MRTIKGMVLAVAMAGLVGCGDPTIDGSSEAAAKESIEKIGRGLDEGKRAEFQRSIQVLAFQELDVGEVLAGRLTPEAAAGKMYKALDGKTAAQVIAEADAVIAEREAKQRQQALAEIAELEAKAAQAEAAKAELAKFKVHRSRFYIKDGEWSFERTPIIELQVENGTAHAISRAYFRGTLATPGRSVPWVQDSFNYAIPGGLEPGETVDWALKPNMFSDWGKASAPEDAVFTVEVVKLDGADGKTLFDASGLSSYESNRLKELKQQYQTQ